MGVWGGEVFAFLTNHHTFAAVGAPLLPLRLCISGATIRLMRLSIPSPAPPGRSGFLCYCDQFARK